MPSHSTIDTIGRRMVFKYMTMLKTTLTKRINIFVSIETIIAPRTSCHRTAAQLLSKKLSIRSARDVLRNVSR